jgi:hypothetical protein
MLRCAVCPLKIIIVLILIIILEKPITRRGMSVIKRIRLPV